MTSLQEMLQNEAASEPVPMAPVNRIVQTGQARVRRRRVAVVAATVAAVLALAAVAVPLVLTSDSDRDPVDRDRTTGAPTLESAGVAWAHEGTIRFRGIEAEMPPNITSFESTLSAVVMLAADRRPSTIFMLDDTGTVQDIGTTDGDVVADPTGHRVAWMSKVEGARTRELVVYDTDRQEVVATEVVGDPSQSLGYGSYVIAIEGDSVVYGTGGEVYRWTAQGEDAEATEVQTIELAKGEQLFDQRGGVSVVNLAGDRFALSLRPGSDVAVSPDLTMLQLSPDGAFAIAYEGGVSVSDSSGLGWGLSLLATDSGAQVLLDEIPGAPVAAAWTGTGDVVVVSTGVPPEDDLGEDSPTTIWLCTTDGDCAVPSDAPGGTLGGTLVEGQSFDPHFLANLNEFTGSSGTQSATEEPPGSDQP